MIKRIRSKELEVIKESASTFKILEGLMMILINSVILRPVKVKVSKGQCDILQTTLTK